MKQTYGILILTLLILCAASVSAYSHLDLYTTLGNVNSIVADTSSSMTYPAFALNEPNTLNLTSDDYTSCDFGASSQAPFVYDVNDDNIPEVVLVQGSNFNIYDLNCNLIQSIVMGGTLIYPQLARWGIYDANQNILSHSMIALSNNTRISFYAYDDDLAQIVLLSQVNLTGLSHMTCNPNPIASDPAGTIGLFGNLNCILIGIDRITYSLNVGTGILTNNGDQLVGYPPGSSIQYPMTYTNLFTGNSIGIMPFCHESGLGLNCDLLNQAGIYRFTSTMDAPPGACFQPSEQTAFVTKLGTQYRLFRSGNFQCINGGNSYYYGYGYIADEVTNSHYLDLAGANAYFGTAVNTGDQPWVSNWAVGDWNKDGQNEACIMGNFSAGVTSMRCYNSYYQLVLDEDVSAVMSVNQIVMADFDATNSYLGFGTYEGIFYYENSTGNMTRWYSSGHDGASFPAQIAAFGHQKPTFISQDSARTFILKPSSSIVVCGDDVCTAGYENGYSCAADCLITTYVDGEYVGNNDSLCRSGYQFKGYCAPAPEAHACIYDFQCLSEHCSNSRCTMPGLSTQLTKVKNDVVGDDEASGNIVSLIIILAIMGGIIFLAKGSFVGIIIAAICGFIALIILTFMGWASVFILLGAILLITAGIVVVIVVGKGNG